MAGFVCFGHVLTHAISWDFSPCCLQSLLSIPASAEHYCAGVCVSVCAPATPSYLCVCAPQCQCVLNPFYYVLGFKICSGNSSSSQLGSHIRRHACVGEVVHVCKHFVMLYFSFLLFLIGTDSVFACIVADINNGSQIYRPPVSSSRSTTKLALLC